MLLLTALVGGCVGYFIGAYRTKRRYEKFIEEDVADWAQGMKASLIDLNDALDAVNKKGNELP